MDGYTSLVYCDYGYKFPRLLFRSERTMILQSTKENMVRLLEPIMYQDGKLESCWNNLTDDEKMAIAVGVLDIAIITVYACGGKNP